MEERQLEPVPWYMWQSDDFGKGSRCGALAEERDKPFAAGKNQSGTYEWLWWNIVFSSETGKLRVAGYIRIGLKEKCIE